MKILVVLLGILANFVAVYFGILGLALSGHFGPFRSFWPFWPFLSCWGCVVVILALLWSFYNEPPLITTSRLDFPTTKKPDNGGVHQHVLILSSCSSQFLFLMKERKDLRTTGTQYKAPCNCVAANFGNQITSVEKRCSV